MHCAIEFHRYLCKYLDDVRTDDIHTAGPLQYTLDKSIIQPLKSYLREQGVHFQTDLLVSDIGFRPDSEPRTVYNIQASTNGKPVLLPVAAEDICIVTIGSPASGSSTGTSAAPPPVISAKAETLLGYDWSIWYQLAKKSPKFGNPSTFCTHLSESRLGMFVVGLPPSEFNEIYSRVIHEGSGQRNLVSIAQSNWSLKITFPQHQALVDRSEEKFSFLGYALTPDQPGDFVKKPMCACCGDEILSELLGHLDIPLDHILTKAITIPQLLPLGLSPLLARCRGDRPQVIPLNTTNVALVGQYVEIADETVLSLEYSVRCAQLAVHHLMGLTNTISEVKKSFIAARYGDRV